jgi:DNA-dependent RNA polymerase auxiliary subunit epsilon
MSEDKTIERKHHEKLNISVLSIGKIKKIIKNDILDTVRSWQKGRDVQKQCYHLIGPAGVGKTQICYQLAYELTEELFSEYNKANENAKKYFEVLMIKSPVLSRDEFIIPFPILSSINETPTYKMLYSDFVPKDKDSFGLFVIDEFYRGDHTLQQLLWQIQNEYSVHRHDFPKGWFVISTDNPDDSEYSMDVLEDAAGLRRQLHLYVEVNAKEFLDHAIENKFHPYVIEFIQTHPEALYDFESQKIGSVFANPATWEKVSDQVIKMEMNRRIDFQELENKLPGLLKVHMTRRFI